MTQRRASHQPNEKTNLENENVRWRHEISEAESHARQNAGTYRSAQSRIETSSKSFLEEKYDPEEEYRKRRQARLEQERRVPSRSNAAPGQSGSGRTRPEREGSRRQASVEERTVSRRVRPEQEQKSVQAASASRGQRRAESERRRVPAAGTETPSQRRNVQQKSRAAKSTSLETASASTRSSRSPQQRNSAAARSTEQRTRTNSAARRNRPAQTSSASLKSRKKKQNKVFTKKFKRGFLIAWAAFVVLIVVVLIILSSFLKRFEAGLPEHTMDQILKQIETGDLSGLHLVTEDGLGIDDSSLIVDEGSIASYLQQKNTEEALRYVKLNSESSEASNVYSIRSGDEKLLKVYLEKDNSGEQSWKENQTQLCGEKLNPTELIAQIPTECSLSVGGKSIDRSFITEEGAQIQILTNLMNLGFIGPQPTVDTYTVKGIFASPEVVMTDASGKQVTCSLVKDVYIAGFEADEAFAAAQTERVLSLFEPYARYFSGDAGKEVLSAIMLDNSPAYISAASADVSWMQQHDGIELSEQRVENIRKYSDECYSCDIHFKQDILQGGVSVRTWDTNMTWIMVNAGEYYIADLITKNAED